MVVIEDSKIFELWFSCCELLHKEEVWIGILSEIKNMAIIHKLKSRESCKHRKILQDSFKILKGTANGEVNAIFEAAPTSLP